jgi:hypothetical protein
MKIIITESQYKKIFLSNKYNDSLLNEGVISGIIDDIIVALNRGISSQTERLILSTFNKNTIQDVVDEISRLEKLTGNQALALMKLGDNAITRHLLPLAIKGDDQLFKTLKSLDGLNDQISSGTASIIEQGKIDEFKDLLLVKGINEEFIDDALIEYRTINNSLTITGKNLENKLINKPIEKWSDEEQKLWADLRNKKVITEATYNKIVNKIIPGWSELWSLMVKWKNLGSPGNFSTYLKENSKYLTIWGKLATRGMKSFDWLAEPVRLMSAGEFKKAPWLILGRSLIVFGIPLTPSILTFFGITGNVLAGYVNNMIKYLNTHRAGDGKDDILDFLKDDGSKILLPDGKTFIEIYGTDIEKNDYLPNIDINSFTYNSKTKMVTLSEKGITLNGIKYTTFKWSPDNENLTAVVPTTTTTPKIPTEVEFEKWYKTQPEFTAMDAEDKKSIKFRINEDKTYVVYVPKDENFKETIIGTYVWDGKTYIKK